MIWALKFFQTIKRSGNLATGNIVASVLYLLAIPVLSRLYGSTDFAYFGVYLGILGYASIAASGRFEYAIHVAECEKDKLSCRLLAKLSGIFVGGILALLLLPVAIYTQLPSLSYIAVLFVSVVSTAFFKAEYFYSNVKAQYRGMAVTRILSALVTIATSVSLYWLDLPGMGLLLGSVTGVTVNGLLLYMVVNRGSGRAVIDSNLWVLTRRFINFPLMSVLSGISASSIMQLPTMIVFSIFGAFSGGQLAMCFRVLAAPLTTLSNAVGDVLRFEFGMQAHNVHKRVVVAIKYTLFLAVLGCPLLLLSFYGQEVFEFLLGMKWSEAGRFSEALSVSFYMAFIAGPISRLALILEKNKTELIVQLIGLIVFLLVLLGAWWLGLSSSGFVFVISVVIGVKYFFDLIVAFYLIGNSK